ncbi:MAG: dTDP-4-amino-4,6-dideoxygalactose transaminase [Pseudomonadota bacterium]
MSTPIRFNEPYITGNEIEYIKDVFRRGHFQGNGHYTRLCHELIGRELGGANVLLTDSCTSALEISALLVREDRPQSVVVPSYTFSTTASAFARAGFEIEFADVNPDTMMLDPGDVRNRITETTVAVVAVHYGGHAAPLDELGSLCEERGLVMIEDAAQAFGCRSQGRPLGTFGRLGCFSFHETKNLHAGLGGALVLNDAADLDRATHIWERGTNRQDVLKGVIDKYSWVEIGGSFYPTELQAAFLAAQLESIQDNVTHRRELYDAYLTALTPIREAGRVNFPLHRSDFESNYHAFFVVFDSEAVCDAVRESLQALGIACYIGYVPLHSSKVGLAMGYRPEDLPITEEYSKRLLRLPFHNGMQVGDARRVANELIAALGDSDGV